MSHKSTKVGFTPVTGASDLFVSSDAALDRTMGTHATVRLNSDQIFLRFTLEQARALAAALMEHAERAEVIREGAE